MACAICDFANVDDSRFCSRCGAPVGAHEMVGLSPVFAAPVQTPGILPMVDASNQHVRIWLPSHVFAYDQWGESYPALEWQQYEVSY